MVDAIFAVAAVSGEVRIRPEAVVGLALALGSVPCDGQMGRDAASLPDGGLKPMQPGSAWFPLKTGRWVLVVKVDLPP